MSRAVEKFVPQAADPVAKAKITALGERLDTYLRGRLEASGATGVAAGIVLEGELVYARSLGVLARGSQAPVDGDTVFRIASLSKSFTALAVLKLRDEGKLSLDVPVSEYLPELRAALAGAPEAAPVTARLLLTHAAGLPWDDTWGAVSFGFDEADFDRLLGAGLSFARAPGTTFEYSNLGYALLGRLVARVSGVPFHDYVTRNILRPLGMNSTVWAASSVPPGRLAVGYWGDAEPLREAPRIPDGVFEPAGGVYTSLHDYARYLAFQVSAYSPRAAGEGGPVRRSTLREMHQAQRRVGALDPSVPVARRTHDGLELNLSSYGFGWVHTATCSHEAVEHGGWEPGYMAYTLLLPQHRLALVTLATTQSTGATRGMLELLRDAHALPTPLQVTPSPELLDAQRSVLALLNQWEPATVARTFDSRCARYPWFAGLQENLAKLERDHGRCKLDGDLRVQSRLSGAWTMLCERGTVEFTVDLTPAIPPQVHMLRWKETLPPDERLATAAARLAAAVDGSPEPVLGMLAPSLARERVRKLLAHAGIEHGACTVERSIGGNGHTHGAFMLACTSGPAELAVELDRNTGRITEAQLHRPHERTAVCWP